MKLGDIEFLGDGVNVPLAAAERHGGMPWAVSQLASSPPLVMASSGSQSFGFDRGRGGDDARLIAREAERFVVEPAIELHAAAFAGRVAHAGGRAFERAVEFP